MRMDDASMISMGQSSTALAMANDAIDNARRAAASSRMKRASSPPPHTHRKQHQQQYHHQPSHHHAATETNNLDYVNESGDNNTASYTESMIIDMSSPSNISSRDLEDLDLKHNDAAFNVVATLLCERLLPKIADMTDVDDHYYTISAEDVTFFQKMLPNSVRRDFVNALRYRLNLLRVVGVSTTSGGIVHHHHDDDEDGGGGGGCEQLSLQCQMLGLDRDDNMNLLLDNNFTAGKRYLINYQSQDPDSLGHDNPGYTQYSNEEQSNHAVVVDTRNDYDTTSTNYRGGGGGGGGVIDRARLNVRAKTTGSMNNNRQHSQSFPLVIPTRAILSPTAAQQHASSPQTYTNYSLETDHHNNGGGGGGNIISSSGAGQQSSPHTSQNNLARKQLLAEIKETDFLMRGSVTSDAINFWKKHLDDLNHRLAAMTKAETVWTGDGGGKGRSTPNSGGGGGGGYGNQQQTRGTQSKSRLYFGLPSTSIDEPMIDNSMGGEGVLPTIMDYNHSVKVDATTSPSMGGSINRQQQQQQQSPLPLCDVVAPSDLPGGYMFEAQLGDKKFLATVPVGGVAKGQRFTSTMRELENIQIPVPLGAWRDYPTECFNDGIFHPLFCNTLFFPCIALGQIMTRTELDWRGVPTNRLVSSASCANMTVLLSFWIVMNISGLVMLKLAWQRGYIVVSGQGAEYYAPLILLNGLLWVYMVSLTRKVRTSIRKKYQIPEECCDNGMEDIVCATCCMPCTICHMGRHTADFDTYRATCCTRTGLPRQVELAQVPLYEDDYQNMNDNATQYPNMNATTQAAV